MDETNTQPTALALREAVRKIVAALRQLAEAAHAFLVRVAARWRETAERAAQMATERAARRVVGDLRSAAPVAAVFPGVLPRSAYLDAGLHRLRTDLARTEIWLTR